MTKLSTAYVYWLEITELLMDFWQNLKVMYSENASYVVEDQEKNSALPKSSEEYD